MAFKPDYKEAFVVTQEEYPFQVTLNDNYNGVSHICYKIEDDYKVKALLGYIGDNSTPEGRAAIKADERYIATAITITPEEGEPYHIIPADESVWMQDDYKDE